MSCDRGQGAELQLRRAVATLQVAHSFVVAKVVVAMRLYNAESCTPMAASGSKHVVPKTSPTRRELPQSPTAFVRNWHRQTLPNAAATTSNHSTSRPNAAMASSACFDPFDIESQFQFSSGPFAKNSCSRSAGTSVTEKLTPVVSSESRDLFPEPRDFFAVSEGTDDFFWFRDPFAPTRIDPQAQAEGDLFNDSSTWMSSSTLSTKFTNHELVGPKGREGIKKTSWGRIQPARDERPNEVFVRTMQPPPRNFEIMDTDESFPPVSSDPEAAPNSERQWWQLTAPSEKPFEPFAATNSTIPTSPAANEQEHSDDSEKENQDIQSFPQQYAAAKANLRRVSKKVVRPPQDPTLVARREARLAYEVTHKKDTTAVPSLQQSNFRSFPEPLPVETTKGLGRALSACTAPPSAEVSLVKAHTTQLRSSTAHSVMVDKNATSGEIHRLAMRRPPLTGTAVKTSSEAKVSRSTDDVPSKMSHASAVSSQILNSTKTHLTKKTSKPVFNESTSEMVSSPLLKGATPPVARLQDHLSSDATNSARARLGNTFKYDRHATDPGAPGSFLAERVEAVRPEAVVSSSASSSRPTGSDGKKESSPVASKVNALRNMLNMRLAKKEVVQNSEAKLPEPSSSDECEKTAVAASVAPEDETSGMLPVKKDPKYAKYFRMLKMGLPMGAVKQAMERDGLDSSVMDGDHDAPTSQKTREGTSLKDDPKYAKYFKMMKMGLPVGAVKQAMERDGLDSSVLDGDHNAPSKQQTARGVTLKDDPKYSKYFKMMKMGLPLGAVKQAMVRDGLDGSLLDGDHSAPVGHCTNYSRAAPAPKDKYRRTRVYWDTHSTVRSNTVWAMLRRDPDVAELSVDEEEFSRLFQAEAKSKPTQHPTTSSATEKSVVKVIDSKRANNGGITLARIKLTYEEIASAVDCYDDSAFSNEQIRGILQYLPTAEEMTALRKYLDGGYSVDSLCECEKFMVSIMKVKHAKRKLDAILYIQKFTTSLEELRRDARFFQKACDEIMASSRFRKILGIVLYLGNRLNTAGPVMKEPAVAVKLESLLKLNQARAFDKKTTFLQYVVSVVGRNNASLCHFKDDLSAVLMAEKIVWESTLAELKRMEDELESVRRLALYHALERDHTHSSSQVSISGDSEAAMTMPSKISVDEEIDLLGKTSIGQFTLDACSRTAVVVDEVNNAKTSYNALLLYFGEEDNSSIQPNDVFSTISAFSRDFEAALTVVVETEKAQLKEAKRHSRRKHAPTLTSAVDGSEDSESSGPIQRRLSTGIVGGVLDELHTKPNVKWRRRKHVP